MIRCRADVSERVIRRLKMRELPICVTTHPIDILTNPVGSSTRTSVADIAQQLQRKLPGVWTLYPEHGSSAPLAVSYCALRDIGDSAPPPPLGATEWKLRATLRPYGDTPVDHESTESTECSTECPQLCRKRKRLQKLATLADSSRNAYSPERRAARRLLSRETHRLDASLTKQPGSPLVLSQTKRIL